MPSTARPSKSAARRSAPRRSSAPAAGRPVQLELFGPRTGPSKPRPAATPSPASAPNAAAAVGRPIPRAAARRLSAAEAEARRFELLRRLNRFAGGKVSDVSLHDNRRVILSVRAERTGTLAPLQLRIHRSFIEAPESVLQAVAEFVRSRKGSPNARQALGVIREHFHRHRPADPKSRQLDPVGSCLDLNEILDDLNARYFEGRLEVDITWGRSLRSPGRRCRGRRGTATIQLGSYAYEDKLVRIHRALDDSSVPRFVVEAVVYHELLHADLPPVTVNGRHQFHTPEFRRRERLFRQLAKTESWIEENLASLLFRRDPKARGKEPRRA
jgi:hypothetical protein